MLDFLRIIRYRKNNAQRSQSRANIRRAVIKENTARARVLSHRHFLPLLEAATAEPKQSDDVSSLEAAGEPVINYTGTRSCSATCALSLSLPRKTKCAIHIQSRIISHRLLFHVPAHTHTQTHVHTVEKRKRSTQEGEKKKERPYVHRRVRVVLRARDKDSEESSLRRNAE